MNSTAQVPQITRWERLDRWIMRRWWRFKYGQAHRRAFDIATMGFETNGSAQVFLDNARDELYRAAREFAAMAEATMQRRLSENVTKSDSGSEFSKKSDALLNQGRTTQDLGKPGGKP